MKTTSSKPLTARQQRELDALIALPEEQIDTTDIPEQRDWSGARRGVFLSLPEPESPPPSTPDEVR